MLSFIVASAVLICITNGASIPTVSLKNAANKDLKMPVVGLGTFGYYPYGSNESENWTNKVAYNATIEWHSVGGSRYDTAYGYMESKQGVANAILEITDNYNKIPRSDIFITEKVGGDNGNALGYDNIMQQFNGLLKMFNTTYFDLLLIHWPSCTAPSISSDPVCTLTKATNKNYNASLCRQHSWHALMDIYNNGSAKAIGVANFEIKHLNDIFAMNSLLPAINQFEFHGYWHEFGLLEFCQSNNITVNSYAPLGAPDVEANGWGGWPYVLPENPIAIEIAKNHNGKTAAQVWLRWAFQQNIVINPRTLNIEHMKENVDYFDFELSDSEMQQLNNANSTAPSYPKDKVCPDPNTYN